MKTPQERGALGHWLREQRIKAGYDTAAKLHAALARARIYVNLPDYRSLESGAKTRAPNGFLDQLATFYGTKPPDQTPGGESMAALIEALTQQTKAISALVERLDSAATFAVGAEAAQLLRELVGSRGAGESPSASPAPPPT